MKMTDLAPGGRLLCASEHHPLHADRDSMYFLEQKAGFFVFACRLCTEILRHPQIHVVSSAHNGAEIYRNTRKADHLDRNSQGQIVSFR